MTEICDVFFFLLRLIFFSKLVGPIPPAWQNPNIDSDIGFGTLDLPSIQLYTVALHVSPNLFERESLREEEKNFSSVLARFFVTLGNKCR